MTTITITNEDQLELYYTRFGTSRNADYSVFTTRAAAEAHYSTNKICTADEEWQDTDFATPVTFTVVS